MGGACAFGAALAHGCHLSPLRGSAAVGYARMGIADIALTTMSSLSITLQLPTFIGNIAIMKKTDLIIAHIGVAIIGNNSDIIDYQYLRR